MTLKQIFPILLILSFILGVLFKSVSQYFVGTMSFFIMFAMYLGFLSMNISSLLKEVKNWKYHAYLTALKLILIPIFAFFVTDAFVSFAHFDEQWKLGALVLFGISAGVTAPPLIKLFHGNFERALINTIITSLCVVFTLPLLLFLFTGEQTQINLVQISLSLAMMIGIPFVFAIISRLYLKKFSIFLNHHNANLNILSLVFVLFGVGYTLQVSTISHSNFFEGLFLLFLLNILHFFLGWRFAFDSSISNKFTAGALQIWFNPTLAMVIATQFFAEKYTLVVLFTILSEIPWILAPIFFRWFLKTDHQKSKNI